MTENNACIASAAASLSSSDTNNTANGVVAVQDQLEQALWVFGYGSLVYNAGFKFAERVPGFVRGLVRRFWQGSTDHRGVPGAPGRVVTLVHEPDGVTWGYAYRVAPEHVQETLRYLDYREKGGYTTELIQFQPRESGRAPIVVTVYNATESNPNFLGPARAIDIATTIASSVGPSGPNIDYFRHLVAALHEIDGECVDDHLREIEQALAGLSGL
ncbi:ChaC family protein [Capsaspora owczarzaki ATCC 30864]|uniref:glutathione-specific gamma-glutamylcyclotransferase n=1 Tax=Capsaspora owczarzaki (strain ATCC 30864) TaxID=595528 RepID=A0A0D2WKP1_CAPO3|nr:ChaC family protein [Capsaspora owczarzaki ATCC 30864]KJE90895.1 ChaC family protein [Capsaspora owczarzaki ATCC 30864]|eukprot:XP_004348879.1 ChaC family protein [Capsaspora owczarzaki ATCC 30864]